MRVLGWALVGWMGASGVAMAQDTVDLSFAWPEAQAKRVIMEWSFEVVDGDGMRRTTSGVIREIWRVRKMDSGWVLSASDRSVVRMGDRRDEAGMAITRAFDSAWRAEFDGEMHLVGMPEEAPVPPPAPMPTVDEVLEADEPAAEPEAMADGEATDADGSEEGEAEEEEIEVEPPLSNEQIVAMVAEDRARALERLFGTFHNQSLPSGQDQRSNVGMASPSTGEMDQAEVLRRLDKKPWCPGTGPGTACVKLSLTRAYDGADPLAMMVESGQRRDHEAWVVEPGTLVPHFGEQETVVARDDSAGRRWTYRATRTYRFLPNEEPTAPEAVKPATP